MTRFNLGSTDVDDEKARIFSTCIHNIEMLDVSECQMTPSGFMSICKAIKQRPYPVPIYAIYWLRMKLLYAKISV